MKPATINSDLSVADAYDHCRSITHRHGANFSVGFRFLPPGKRRAVYAAYAFCRIADDIADDPGSHIEQRLDEWQAELERCYEGLPRHPVTLALADALERFPIPKRAFVDLIDGCRQDLIKTRYPTFEELLGYCNLVATSISEISLPIFGYRTPAAHRYGESLATALQLTNITRDVGDDLRRDRIYVPLEELDRFGVREQDLIGKHDHDGLRALMLFQIDRATGYFRDAEPLLRELSFGARFPTLLMGGVYATVLQMLRRDPLLPLRKRLSLSKARKVSVVLSRLLRPHFA
ncbi:MAG TPA: squalene/phytoene synthase family protein [Thermoanaerobaculia bacterium]|nr:squalene/phytoene synthase family protein [Thermoanaerobaculia bacterium]